MRSDSISSSPSVIITGVGHYVPHRAITNDDLAQKVDTSDEWVRARTGIGQRHIAGKEEQCSDMAAEAGRRALGRAKVPPDEIDLLIIGTMTPDMLFPSTACLVQHKMGLRPIPAFDIGAACTGFLYILEAGACMLRFNNYRKALLIGAEKLSSVLDWEDRSTCVLFGDGAGAVVLERAEDMPETGVLGSILGSDGSRSGLIHMPAGGSALPAAAATLAARQHFLKMNGREVFKMAVRVMEQGAREILERHGIGPGDVACVVPHQANNRILESLSVRLGIGLERFYINVERYGNTSAASVPIALDEAARQRRFKSGDYVLLLAFGAGLTWGAALIKWTGDQSV